MKVFAYSKSKFNRFMKEQGIDDSNVESFDIYAFISILDVSGLDTEGHFEREHSNVKIQHFGDYGDLAKNKKGVFSKKQADELIDFVEANKDKQIFIVHCSAGISRSGATATFINDLFGNSYKEFFNDNRQIQPNYCILSRLREQYRKKYLTNYYESKNDTTTNI
jgi:predicted protein tyrosine phosphatase